jgi:hypothetical protein
LLLEIVNWFGGFFFFSPSRDTGNLRFVYFHFIVRPKLLLWWKILPLCWSYFCGGKRCARWRFTVIIKPFLWN